MPDARAMSGIPRPVTDLPDGSISVRVIRGELSNNISNQPVQLRVGDKVLTAKTDEAGRAQFDNVTPGAAVKASTDVAGEHLRSFRRRHAAASVSCWSRPIRRSRRRRSRTLRR
jgi:hypothetical protein